MKLLILLGTIVNFYIVSSSNSDCDVLKRELLTRNAASIYIMHSYIITNKNSFNKNINGMLTFPDNRTSYSLPRIYEHLNNLDYNYSINFNDSYYIGMQQVYGTKMELSSKFGKTCEVEQMIDRFAVIILVNEPNDSIIFYGCNILTGKSVIIVMFESKTMELTTDQLVMIDLKDEEHLFLNEFDSNRSTCICKTSQYAAKCLEWYIETRDKNDAINNIFYIYISIIFLMIILLYVIHKITESNDDT